MIRFGRIRSWSKRAGDEMQEDSRHVEESKGQWFCEKLV